MDMTRDVPTWVKLIKKDHALIEERCFKGIPASIRGRAWTYLSSADEFKAKSENYDFMVPPCRPVSSLNAPEIQTSQFRFSIFTRTIVQRLLK